MMERNPKVAATIITNIARLVCKRLVQANENLECLQKNLSGKEGLSAK